MKNKTLNHLLGSFLKRLLKLYTQEKQTYPIAVHTDIGNVVVDKIEGEGYQSHIPGHPFPFPGMPDSRIVETLTVIKRIFPIIYKWAWIVMRDRLPKGLIEQSQNGEIGLVDPDKYSRPVREFHRAFTKIRSKENDPEMRAKWTEMRDILCLFFEYDDAYRFRLMEAMQELDKTQFEYTDADAYWAGHKWNYNFDSKKIKEVREKYHIKWK
jgi:hypothetical protein